MYRSILWTSFPEQYSLCDAFDPSSSSSEKLTSVHQTTPCSIVEGIKQCIKPNKVTSHQIGKKSISEPSAFPENLFRYGFSRRWLFD